MAEAQRWKNRPEGSTWGDFGADDQLGRLNLLTSEKVLQGVAEVREGRNFCLSLPLDYPGGNALNPRRHPPAIRPTRRDDGTVNYIFRMETEDPRFTDVINDDAVVLHLQYSTQWDSLAHVGSMFDADGDGTPEAVFYNGYRAGEHFVPPTESRDAGAFDTFEARTTVQATALTVDKMAETCLQGRAVMIDLHAHFGRARKAVGYDDLMRIIAADGITVEPGDLLCFRTGFDQVVLEMGRDPDPETLHGVCTGLDGSDAQLRQWITDSGVVSLIADNYAVELHPETYVPGRCAGLPLHEHCLFKLGVNLGELWNLSELADWLRANNRSRFLLTAPPLRLPGAVGSPATPVATV